MSTQGLVNYTITSMAQFATYNTKNVQAQQNTTNPFISDYVSTTNQAMIADSKQNNAIRSNALAGLTLSNGNSSVNKLNSYMNKVKLYEKLASA